MLRRDKIVFAILVVFFIVSLIMIFCHCEQEPSGGKDSCGFKYVTKDIFANIDGKKEKIAQVKVAECNIKIVRTKKPNMVKFLFNGNIRDSVKNDCSKSPGCFFYPVKILAVVYKEGRIVFGNPFEGGYCHLKVAYQKNGKMQNTKEEFVFNPNK